MKNLALMVCIILFTCCKNAQVGNSVNDLRTLTFKEAAGALEDTAFFKSKVILPLETNDLALIGQIGRIYMANDTLFVLDKNFQSIIIYNKDGKYVNSIRNVGAGPKEYVELGDICVDNVNKELIVLCTRPSKVQFYSYQGKFLREKYLGELFYTHLGTDGKYLYFQDDTNINESKEIAIYDQHLNHKADTLEHGKVFKNNESGTVNRFGQGNAMTQDSSIHIVREFDNTIYGAKNGIVYPKYRLDFKQHTLPESLLESKMKPFEFLDICREKKYVISLKEVVENSKFLLFTTNIGLFLCDKQSGEMTRHIFILDSTLGMGSSDVQVIGNTNKIAVVWSISRLKSMMEARLKNPQDKGVNMDFVKKLNEMDDENNAILFIYEF